MQGFDLKQAIADDTLSKQQLLLAKLTSHSLARYFKFDANIANMSERYLLIQSNCGQNCQKITHNDIFFITCGQMYLRQ